MLCITARSEGEMRRPFRDVVSDTEDPLLVALGGCPATLVKLRAMEATLINLHPTPEGKGQQCPLCKSPHPLSVHLVDAEYLRLIFGPLADIISALLH